MLIRKIRISESQQNQRINAIKFYYEKVLGKNKELYDIDRAKKKKRLPVVLSKEDMFDMINNTSNIKHKAILAIYIHVG